MPHVLDHIQPKQHMGGDDRENLAFCCVFCNQQKGPNLAGLDPKTGLLTRLFNPRTAKWGTHLKWAGTVLKGRTAIGRVIVYIMGINDFERVAMREALVKAGRW